MGKRESGIQDRTVNLIKQEFLYATMRVKHGTAFAVAGDPDIYGCVLGRFVAFEIKNEDGRLTKIQEYRLLEFGASRAITGAIRDPEDAIRIIQKGLKS